MQLCAEDNMQVLVPSTPAQAYHMLRRQMLRPMRRPLIVMSPKSLLRHRLGDVNARRSCRWSFQPVIHEIDDLDANGVDRLVFCSGKVYYDLLEARRKAEIGNVALVRLEQLYPFPYDEMTAAVKQFPNAKIDCLVSGRAHVTRAPGVQIVIVSNGYCQRRPVMSSLPVVHHRRLRQVVTWSQHLIEQKRLC